MASGSWVRVAIPSNPCGEAQDTAALLFLFSMLFVLLLFLQLFGFCMLCFAVGEVEGEFDFSPGCIEIAITIAIWCAVEAL